MKKVSFLIILLFLSYAAMLQAQFCAAPTISTSNYYSFTCRNSPFMIEVNNPIVGATYTWTNLGGLTLLNTYPTSILVSAPFSGTYNVEVEQLCPPFDYSFGSLVVEAGGGLRPATVGNYPTVTGPDSVVAGVSYNYSFEWNCITLGPGANNGSILHYPSATGNYWGNDQQLPCMGGPQTNVVPLQWSATQPQCSLAVHVIDNWRCPDTVYKPIFVLGAFVGPNSVCAGAISTYTLPVGTVNSWTVTGGVILSGQGTSTVQIQWGVAGNAGIDCNWTFGNFGTQTTHRNITIYGGSGLTITGSSTLCNASQTYSVPYVQGHFYRWTINGVPASTVNSVSLLASNSPTYTVVLYDSIPGCVSTGQLLVTNAVYPHPVLTSNPQACLGGPVTITAPSILGATYNWTAPTGTILSGQGTNAVVVNYSTVGFKYPQVQISVGPCSRIARDTIELYAGAAVPNLGPNVAVCPGTPVAIVNSGYTLQSGVTYLSSTGTTLGTGFTANTFANHWLSATTNMGAFSCTLTDSVLISSLPALVTDLGPDVLMCFSPNTVLSPTVTGFSGPFNYAWNTGATIPSVTVGNGVYSVTVSASGYCTDADTVEVLGALLPTVGIQSPTTTLCPGGSMTLVADPGYTSYLWATGATTASIVVGAAGTYAVTATDGNGCQSVAALTITLLTPPSFILGGDTSICPDTFAVCQAAPFVSYLWSNAATTSSIVANSAGDYIVTVTDGNGCTWADTLTVTMNSDCIWPGDANHDGIANNADILDIAYALNSTGPQRLNASSAWYGQVCTDWSQAFPSTLNFKHADCDGNGAVENLDTLVVIQNYGLTHNKGAGTATGPSLSLVPLQPIYYVGDTLALAIYLGDSSTPAAAIQGIAYSLALSGISTAPGDLWFSFPSSFLGNAGNSELAVAFENVAPGLHDLAQGRIGANPVSGFGHIATLYIRTDSMMLPLPQNVLNFSFPAALLVDGQLGSIPVAPSPATVIVYEQGFVANSEGVADRVKAYPVPADNYLVLQRHERSAMLTVTVTDLTGKALLRHSWDGLETEIQTESLGSGTYLLVIRQGDQVVQHIKVSVLHD